MAIALDDNVGEATTIGCITVLLWPHGNLPIWWMDATCLWTCR
jgi:hypothetical protein